MANSVEGMEQLKQKLDKIADGVGLEQAMKQAAALVEADAKRKAPKGHGELRRSIASKVENTSGTIQGVVYSPIEYAPYVEYGTGLFAEGGNGRKDVPWFYQDEEGEWHSTSGMAPSPYLRPALQENVDKIKDMLKGGIVNGK